MLVKKRSSEKLLPFFLLADLLPSEGKMYAQGFCSVGRQNCVLEKLWGNAAYGASCRVSSHCRSPKGDLA